MKYFLYIAAFLSISLYANEPNKSIYDAYQLLSVNYDLCKKSVHSYNYWKFETGCFRSTNGVQGGVCLGNEDQTQLLEYVPKTSAHCEILKPDRDEIVDFYRYLNKGSN